MHEESIDNKDSDFVKTPKFLVNKMIVLNPLTKDKKSFMDAVTLSLYSKTIRQNNTRPSNIRKYSDCINWEDIDFPPTVQDYGMLEKNNKNISLNVLEIGETERFNYIYKSSDRKGQNKSNIVRKKHYVYLKSIFCINVIKLFSDTDFSSDSD